MKARLLTRDPPIRAIPASRSAAPPGRWRSSRVVPRVYSR